MCVHLNAEGIYALSAVELLFSGAAGVYGVMFAEKFGPSDKKDDESEFESRLAKRRDGAAWGVIYATPIAAITGVLAF